MRDVEEQRVSGAMEAGIKRARARTRARTKMRDTVRSSLFFFLALWLIG